MPRLDAPSTRSERSGSWLGYAADNEPDEPYEGREVDPVRPSRELVLPERSKFLTSDSEVREKGKHSDVVRALHTAQQKMRYVAEHSKPALRWPLGVGAGREDGGVDMHICSHVLSHLVRRLVPQPFASEGERVGKAEDGVDVERHLRLHALRLLLMQTDVHRDLSMGQHATKHGMPLRRSRYRLSGQSLGRDYLVES